MNRQSNTTVNWQINDPVNMILEEIKSARTNGISDIRNAIEKNLLSTSPSTATIERSLDTATASIHDLGKVVMNLSDDYCFGVNLVPFEKFNVDEAIRQFDASRSTWVDGVKQESLRLTKLRKDLYLLISEFRERELARDKRKAVYDSTIVIVSILSAIVVGAVETSLAVLPVALGVAVLILRAKDYKGLTPYEIRESVRTKKKDANRNLETESSKSISLDCIIEGYTECIRTIEMGNWRKMVPNNEVDSIRLFHLSAERRYNDLTTTVSDAVGREASSQVFQFDFAAETIAMIKSGDLNEEAYGTRIQQYLHIRQPIVEQTANEEALKEISKVIKRYLTFIKQYIHQVSSVSGISLRKLEESIVAATNVRNGDVDIASEDLDSLASIVIGAGAIGGGIISGGAGVALIASGPIGWIAGAAIAGLALTQRKGQIKSMLGAMGFGLTEKKVRDHFSLIETRVRERVGESVSSTCSDIHKQLSHIQESVESAMIGEFRAKANRSRQDGKGESTGTRTSCEAKDSDQDIHQFGDTDNVLWSELSYLYHRSDCQYITSDCRKVSFTWAKTRSRPCPHCCTD